MKRINLLIIPLIAVFLFPAFLHAWDGFDYDTGDYVEIDDQDSLKPGNQIIIYDYADQSYHEVEIISLNNPGKPELEVFDYDADEYRNFEMEEAVKGQASALLTQQQTSDHPQDKEGIWPIIKKMNNPNS